MASKQSSEAAWLGLDLGTQSVRAMVVSGTGETLGAGSHKLTSRRAGPRHEQDPDIQVRKLHPRFHAAYFDLRPKRNHRDRDQRKRNGEERCQQIKELVHVRGNHALFRDELDDVRQRL
jgi:ribulose kinase